MKTTHPTKVLLCIGIVLSISFAHAQTATHSVEKLTGRLYSIANRYRPAVFRPVEDYNPAVIESVFNINIADSLSLARADRAQAYQEYLQKDLGLRAAGSYINNFSDGFEELGFFFRSSYNVGLEWNVLKDGYFSNQFSARETALNERIRNETSGRNNTALLNFMLGRVNQRFDKDIRDKKAFVLQFISEYEKLSRDLYLSRFILWEDYLDISNRKKELEMDIQSKKAVVYRALRPQTSADKLPLLVLADSAMTSLITPETNALLQLKDEENSLRYAFWRDISMRPFFRYNHFVYDVAIPDRDFVSGGISLSVPLSFRQKAITQMKATSRNELRAELNQQHQSDHVLLSGLKKQYNETLTSYLKHLNASYVVEEQLRKEAVKRDLGDPEFTPMRTLLLIRQWLEEDVLLIETKASLYRLLVQISFVTKSSPEKFTRPLIIPYETFTVQTAKEKAIYIWSSDFRKQTVSDLSHFLTGKRFSRVLLSVDMNDSLRLKSFDLVNLLQQYEISVELMVANNSLVLKQNRETLKEVLDFNSQVPGITGIHFDVEPHVRDDWKDNKTELMSQYRDMIIYARQVLPKEKVRISVSIPVSYSMDEIGPIKEYIDDVYLMAYEHTDVSYVKRKIEEELAVFGTKLVIALSMKDFKDEEAMEVFMEEIKQATGINRFAVHGFGLYTEVQQSAK